MAQPKGTLRCYVPKNFSEEHAQIIGAANKIIHEYESQGLSMTLRMLYYQFVARKILPNNLNSYNRLGSIINDGRLAGLVSWTAIEDTLRYTRGIRDYDSVSDGLRALRESYAIDMWANQPWRPEVWIEKDALASVVEGICHQLRVDVMACRGYMSQSSQWRAGRRLASYVQKGQQPIVFHLGDHDPSGIDMTRDNRDRLSMFANTPILVQRLALNMPQIEQYNPPPNPAKMTDSRFEEYSREFGDESWELDALSPAVIRDLIQDAILKIRDEVLWKEMLEQEAEDKDRLDILIEQQGKAS